MTAAPRPPKLALDDVKNELELFHRYEHRTLSAAFYGQGEPGEVRVEAKKKTFQVIPVRCELELREKLARAERDRVDVALLVDYTDRLPLDVQGRLAGGRLQFISREKRLANLFGARAVSPDIMDSPLARALLEEGRAFEPIEGNRVDLKTAWRRFLERRIALPSGDVLTEVSLLRFAAAQPTDDRFARFIKANTDVEKALCDFLRSQVGELGEIVIQSWLAGRGKEAAALTFVLHAVMPHIQQSDYVRATVKQVVKPFWPSIDRLGTSVSLLSRWGELASTLWLRLEKEQSLVLERADAMVRDPDLDPFILDSPYLPRAFAAAQTELANVFSEAAKAVDGDGRGRPSREVFDKAKKAYDRMGAHQLSMDPRSETLVERASMAVRLLGYLAIEPDWDQMLAGHSPREPVFALAEHYAEQGGFVDLARRLARGTATNALGDAIDEVLRAADAAREMQDTLFARALPRYNAERKAGRLVPIEQALDRFAVEFVVGSDRRKLLVLLMDGMAWSTAVELMLDPKLGNYAPLRWRPKSAANTGLPAPVIAALPTITEVSRAAFFSGKLLKAGDPPNSLKDPDRLRDHCGFKKLYGEGPRLMLRTQSVDNYGNLTSEALGLIKSDDRVVAVVINAVDDQLKAKPGIRIRYGRETIKALGPLLDAAEHTGRAILLIADHGHVLGSRASERADRPSEGGARWRELIGEVQAGSEDITFDDANTWRPHKSGRMAMLFRESAGYGMQSHEGEHGGSSLAEVVTPALLIGSERLSREVELEPDEGLEVFAFPTPGWWHFELPRGRGTDGIDTVRKKTSRPPAARKKTSVSEDQLPIFPVEPASAAAQTQEQPQSETVWRERLKKAFAKTEKPRMDILIKSVIPAVEHLIEHDGRLAAEVFAAKMNEPYRNVGGLVAIMGEFLNEDGYEVVRFDQTAKQVKLNVELLQQLFGEER